MEENSTPTPLITMVVAMSENHAIGNKNQLIWHLPNDLQHFKRITSGGTIIMGRKTFDSIKKALPNRRNIVITRQNDLQIPQVEIANNVEQAIKIANSDSEIFIVGGAEIYKQAMPYTNKIYLTKVHHNFEADTFFPKLDENEWEVQSEETHPIDSKHAYSYSFLELRRK